MPGRIFLENLSSTQLSIDASQQQQADLWARILLRPSCQPFLSDKNESRGATDEPRRLQFRKRLLQLLRRHWRDRATEARFLQLANVLHNDGCAVFAGLIDSVSFRQLIHDYGQIMDATGSQAFLHTFAPLHTKPDFLQSSHYNGAMIHPLLVGLMSYAMGGPIRLTDIRGKDTAPISVNSQDNMLHLDDSPFRDEYKILLGWEKGTVKGPTGQNFTYLPGTQMGIRQVRLDDHARSWSTEDDSLFITDESLDDVLNFQKRVNGGQTRVVEVRYPQQPVTIVFHASSLVHHRYRNYGGKDRSCVIMAFHLISQDPGSLIRLLPHTPKDKIIDVLLDPPTNQPTDKFLSTLEACAQNIETKINEILDPVQNAVLVDDTNLQLGSCDLERWRRTVVEAPSATEMKLKSENFITSIRPISQRRVVEVIAGAMAYDKHGRLDLILYDDGYEELRKLARKSIWTLREEQLTKMVQAWLPKLDGHLFSIADVSLPSNLKRRAEQAALIIRESFPDFNFKRDSLDEKERRMVSTHQLITDLGESIVRCTREETFVTTTLFLLLILEQVTPNLDTLSQEFLVPIRMELLKTYIASVLLVEAKYRWEIA